LAERSGNVFLTPGWASVWWRHFGRRRRPLVSICRDETGSAVAVLPLCLSRWPVRRLRFIGHGPADQLGPVCDPADLELVGEKLCAGLVQRYWPWQVFVADRLPGEHDWERILGATVHEREASPLTRIGGLEWDQFLAARSSNFREQVRRRERKLAREHEIRFRLANRETLERDFDMLVGLHKQRWSKRSPAFAGRLFEFHLDFARLALERGWLRLWTLEADGRPVAAWYGFRFAGNDSYYQSGRDPAWDPYRVGFVLLSHTIREAFNDGQREYRMLRGGESYKDRFASEEHEVTTMVRARGTGPQALMLGTVARRVLPYRLHQRLVGPTG
jgi:CelD/BcsL family acetyltransferase involved in cellulose biosynthesis